MLPFFARLYFFKTIGEFSKVKLAIITDGGWLLLGLKNHSNYQRQLRITYWDNKVYSRVKNNSTEWSDWKTLNF